MNLINECIVGLIIENNRFLRVKVQAIVLYVRLSEALCLCRPLVPSSGLQNVFKLELVDHSLFTFSLFTDKLTGVGCSVANNGKVPRAKRQQLAYLC